MTNEQKILLSIDNMVKTTRELVNEIRHLRSAVESNSKEWIDGDKASVMLGRKNPRVLKQHRDSGLLKVNVDYKWNGKSFLYLRKSVEGIRDNVIVGF